MKTQISIYLCILLAAVTFTCDRTQYATIGTEYGDFKIMLYDSTPEHRDNFVKLAKEGFYDGTLFHRIVPGFVVQGGDPDSKTATAGQALGAGGPGYTLPPEIGAPHIFGAVAAARRNTPDKRSNGSQFYIVTGRPVDDALLDAIEQQKKISYNEAQRQLYKELGGTPSLDQEYTVFGEVIEGMEVVERIVALERDQFNRPLTDVPMTVKMN